MIKPTPNNVSDPELDGLRSLLKRGRLLMTHASQATSSHDAALDWNELDSSDKRGADLVRQVATAWCDLLHSQGKTADADAIANQMEHVAQQHTTAQPSVLGDA